MKQEWDAENLKQELKKKEMSDIRRRFEHFKHGSFNETVLRTFAQYMKDKMTSRQIKKTKKRDLGLAAIDSYVIFDQMKRNDSTNTQL